jgi:hypothetical protein
VASGGLAVGRSSQKSHMLNIDHPSQAVIWIVSGKNMVKRCSTCKVLKKGCMALKDIEVIEI